MHFHYRFVPFGTRFVSAEGLRGDAESAPEQLFANELALDIGGACLGVAGEQRAIIDHHFFRPEGQFPSASAAVLHSAPQIKQRLQDQRDIWLVTHSLPDFDAFASMYLARSVLSKDLPLDNWEALGLDPGGWFRRAGTIDWFRPEVRHLPKEQTWAVLLAGYASCVDQCKRIPCPKNRSLHSILQAALVRGRDYLHADSGAGEFFEEVKAGLQAGLNPLYDSILETSARFAPELALLEREQDAYQHDLARARKAVVFLRQADRPFHEWYGQLEGSQAPPLLNGARTLQGAHLLPQHRKSQADGIFLRDPECLLFKEWARLDRDNSSMGEGFLFSAIAYSNGRPGAKVNPSEYFFSLDPERAQGRHLYNVWARLQAREVQCQLDGAKESADTKTCRQGYEGRAGQYGAVFHDPWFDGANFECTIVPAPFGGTSIATPGSRSDLEDDPVAAVVAQELEDSIYQTDLHVWDWPGAKDKTEPTSTRKLRAAGPPPAGTFRFGKVELSPDAQLLQGRLAEQIARLLWGHLEEDVLFPEKGDHEGSGWMVQAHWVGVWSRRGLLVACKPSAGTLVGQWRQQFQELVELSDHLHALLNRKNQPAGRDAREQRKAIVRQGQDLVRRVSLVKLFLAAPESALVNRFFQASCQNEVLEGIFQENYTEQMHDNIGEIAEVQSKVEWLEMFIISVYGVELVHFASLAAKEFIDHKPWPFVAMLVIALAVPFFFFRLLRSRMPMGVLFVIYLAIISIFVGALLTEIVSHPEPTPTKGAASSIQTHLPPGAKSP